MEVTTLALLAGILLASGCTALQAAERPSPAPPAGPPPAGLPLAVPDVMPEVVPEAVIVVDRARLSATRDDACRRFAAAEVTDAARGAADAGMLLPDYEGFRAAVHRLDVTVTFRDSNPACAPHLAAGVQSKVHDILQKTWDASNLMPEDQSLAGLVSNLMAHPPPGEKIAHPQLTLKAGEPVTCDHDMMDMLEADGRRIPGEVARDLEIRAALNAAAAPTPRGHRDRVMHGCQAAYAQYIKLHPGEPVIRILFKPEAPLTVFDHDGKTYHLTKIEDVLDFYLCKGTGLATEWDVEAEDRSVAPPHRQRLH